MSAGNSTLVDAASWRHSRDGVDVNTAILARMRRRTGWTVAYWILFSGWALGAALTMSRARAGFLTNYLADLLFPPWFYIALRRLAPPKGTAQFLTRWFGRSPERAALSILAVGIASELAQRYWPRGPIAGTYDPWDIVAYALDLGICYSWDRF